MPRFESGDSQIELKENPEGTFIYPLSQVWVRLSPCSEPSPGHRTFPTSPSVFLLPGPSASDGPITHPVQAEFLDVALVCSLPTPSTRVSLESYYSASRPPAEPPKGIASFPSTLPLLKHPSSLTPKKSYFLLLHQSAYYSYSLFLHLISSSVLDTFRPRHHLATSLNLHFTDEETGSVKLNCSPKVAELLSAGDRTHTQVCLPLKWKLLTNMLH